MRGASNKAVQSRNLRKGNAQKQDPGSVAEGDETSKFSLFEDHSTSNGGKAEQFEFE